MSPPKRLRAALYMRVSTLEQSVDLQRRDLLAYTEARTWEGVEFVDEGVSGRRDRRPALNEMMKEVRRKRFGAVVNLGEISERIDDKRVD